MSTVEQLQNRIEELEAYIEMQDLERQVKIDMGIEVASAKAYADGVLKGRSESSGNAVAAVAEHTAAFIENQLRDQLPTWIKDNVPKELVERGYGLRNEPIVKTQYYKMPEDFSHRFSTRLTIPSFVTYTNTELAEQHFR